MRKFKKWHQVYMKNLQQSSGIWTIIGTFKNDIFRKKFFFQRYKIFEEKRDKENLLTLFLYMIYTRNIS